MKPVLRQKYQLSLWSIPSQNMLNSLTISQICTNLSSTGYLQGAPQLHHPGQLTIVLSASVYTVSPSVSLPFVRREKHLKLNTGFCGSYSRSETSINSIQTELPAPLCTKAFIQLVTTA